MFVFKFRYYFFIFVFSISFLCPLICNDVPLFVWFDGGLYFPVIFDYPETTWGGDFLTKTNYNDLFVKKLINSNGFYLMPPVEFSNKTIDWNFTGSFPSKPNSSHWFGTDSIGRDVFAQILYGMRFSIIFGFFSTIISYIIGLFIGSFQGYIGGRFDFIGQRIVEVWSGIPFIYLMIVFASFYIPSAITLVFIISFFKWTSFVNVIRVEVLKVRYSNYVKYAQIIGTSRIKIILYHVIPNSITGAITYMPFVFVSSITTLISLDFFGLGLGMESSSLGNLINDSKNNLESPWIGIYSLMSIIILLSSITFIIDDIRNIFDSRKYL